MINAIVGLHHRLFGAIEEQAEGWLLGLLARLVFAGVLFVYYFQSALKKVEEGFVGFFSVTDSAYIQILPQVMEEYGYDAAQIPFIPYGLIVYLGTYAEFVLPVLLVIGLWTRIAALGMAVFVMVQSYVDIVFHHVDAATIGAWFDRLSNAAILDQRAFWLFLLLFLVIKGPGAISVDALINHRRPVPAASQRQQMA